MPLPRIHCDQRLGPGAQFALAPEAAQHVGRALRLKAGDAITVFDGRGGEYEAAIQRIDKDRVEVKVGAYRDVETEPRIRIGLIQGRADIACNAERLGVLPGNARSGGARRRDGRTPGLRAAGRRRHDTALLPG